MKDDEAEITGSGFRSTELYSEFISMHDVERQGNPVLKWNSISNPRRDWLIKKENETEVAV